MRNEGDDGGWQFRFGMVEAALPALPKPDEDGGGGADREQETVE